MLRRSWLVVVACALCLVGCEPTIAAVNPAQGEAYWSDSAVAAAAALADSTPAVTPVIFSGAGNIATCGSDDDEKTAALLDNLPGMVFTAGDNAFPNGDAHDYNACYAPTWGRHLARTWAALGNHEYLTDTAAAAKAYFGERVGPGARGYYSTTVGAWHVIVLNDGGQYDPRNPFVQWGQGSEQERWLEADLAANTSACTLAIWHVPLFLSSNSEGYTSNSAHRILWDDLYAAKVDVVLNGQQHWYERFAPMRPDGRLDTERGIREFNVGTGGDAVVMPTVAIHPNSEVRGAVFGVLSLSLYPDRYDWRFIGIPGTTFTDAGSARCHNASVEPPPPPPPPPNRRPIARSGGPYTTDARAVTFDGTRSSDPDGDALVTYAWSFGDGEAALGAAPVHTYLQRGTYMAVLFVTDARGLASAPDTATVVVKDVVRRAKRKPGRAG